MCGWSTSCGTDEAGWRRQDAVRRLSSDDEHAGCESGRMDPIEVAELPLSLPEVDPEQPSVARIYDYWLGGSQNFAADREVARRTAQALPHLPAAAWANRAFLRRVVRHLVAELGVTQLLDLGSGVPTVGNVHEVAAAANPEARTVYVDIDPVAVAHARALLADTHRAGDPGRPAPSGDGAGPSAAARDAGFLPAGGGADVRGAALRGRGRRGWRDRGRFHGRCGARQLPGALPRCSGSGGPRYPAGGCPRVRAAHRGAVRQPHARADRRVADRPAYPAARPGSDRRMASRAGSRGAARDPVPLRRARAPPVAARERSCSTRRRCRRSACERRPLACGWG